MMLAFSLAYHSLRNRKLTTALTVSSIALSVALVVGVEHVRVGARDGFSNAISQTDLIVGPRSGPLQLLLYAVFHSGSPTTNIAYTSYETFKNHPAVAWAIPYSLGDSHYGFRVVGTSEEFYSRYRYHGDRTIKFLEGRAPEDIFDVAIGSEVSATRGYKLGDPITVTHGITEGRGLLHHDDKPFRVVGILARTATPVDRSLYITLKGVEAIHVDWTDGGPPLRGEEIPPGAIKPADLKIDQVSGFFLRAKSRIDTLRLKREIDTFADQPLMAVIPGVALNELWRTVGYAEDALSVVTYFVLAVGLLGMLVSIYTSLNERRREMAILRALGAGPGKVVLLLVLESALLSAAGAILGVVVMYALSFVAQPVVERQFGVFIPIEPLTVVSYGYLASIVGFGVVTGMFPAAKAYRNALSDGLSVRL
jgi:putative ABC transport system permease protein